MLDSNNKKSTAHSSKPLQASYVNVGALTAPEPDFIDKMVYEAVEELRTQYRKSCSDLGITPRTLSPVVLGMRSVR